VALAASIAGAGCGGPSDGGSTAERVAIRQVPSAEAASRDVSQPTNPGFEGDDLQTAPADWAKADDPNFPFSTFRVEDGWSSSGRKSLRVTAQKDDSTTFRLGHARPDPGHVVPIQGGRSYSFRAAWNILDSVQGPPTPRNRLGLSLDFYDASGAGGAFTWDNFAGKTGRVFSKLTGKAPPGTTQVLLNIAVGSSTPNDRVDFYIDDLSFRVGTHDHGEPPQD
jgi:hypothetical protein